MAPGRDHDRYRTASGISDGSAVGLSRGGGVREPGEPDPGDRIRGEIRGGGAVLASFGADVSVHGDSSHNKGRYPLLPGVVETPDLCGAEQRFVAALSADGLSVVSTGDT